MPHAVIVSFHFYFWPVFYKMLRPEIVATNPVPLCSDALRFAPSSSAPAAIMQTDPWVG